MQINLLMDTQYTPFDGRAESSIAVSFDFPGLESNSVCEHWRIKVIADVDALSSEPKRRPLTQIADFNSDDDDIVQICRHGCATVGTARPANGTYIRIYSHFIESGRHKSKALPTVNQAQTYSFGTLRAFLITLCVVKRDLSDLSLAFGGC